MAPSNTHYDVVIVGGGIVGLATGLALTKREPKLRMAILEKEPGLGAHQSGRNSGVIHSGIYYRPGSLKAAYCRQGAQKLIAFCRTQSIPFELCGKVIIAADQTELPRLAALYQRGLQNQIRGLRRMSPEELKEREPHAQGLGALHIPEAGIVDFQKVLSAYADIFQKQGGEILTATGLKRTLFRAGELLLITTRGEFACRFLVNCAGLFSDRLSRQAGSTAPLSIIPFRGEYYELIPEKRRLVKNLLYPVPDPRLPFLGVHFSRRIDGRVEAGPNAVVALKREGYRKRDFNLRDTIEMLAFPGFWRMSGRYWRIGWQETLRSLMKKRFVRSLQRLIPEVQEQDLLPAPGGVRAQAVDIEGNLLDDFHLIEQERMLHVVNAPSPAATASLAIGEQIAETALRRLKR